MFGFLKKKIKETSEKIAEEIEEDAKTISEDQINEEEKQELEQEKKSFFKKIFSKKDKEEIKSIEEEIAEEQAKVDAEEPIVEEKEKAPIEEEIKEGPIEDIVEPVKEEVSAEKEFKKEKRILGIFKKKHKEEKKQEEPYTPKKPYITEEKVIEEVKTPVEEVIEGKEEKIIDPTRGKKGLLKKLSEKIKKLNITDEKFDELFWDLEVALMENNVAVEVIEKIKENLKQELESTKITRRSINEIILNNLRQTIESLFNYEPIDLLEKIKSSEKPYKILMLGVNGSGKTTTIGKLIKYFQDNGLTSVIAASDTFRAAAIQQIEEHANNLNTKLIKHDYGADPAAVAYDTIEHAKSKAIDVVLIDTAGRLHSNSNLMQELEKIIRVAKPDMKIFIGESITGNDCVEQAKQFNDAIGIDSIILTKADVDEKGGVAVSISQVIGKPIIFITTGQEYKDLEKFNAKDIIDSIFEE